MKARDRSMPANPTASTDLRVKICGLTSEEAVDAAVSAGATHLGFVLAESPRRVSPERARALAERVPEHVMTVGVLRHPRPAELDAAMQAFGPDLIQTEVDPVVLETVPTARLLPVLHDSSDLMEEALTLANRLGRPGPAILEAQGQGGRGVRPDWPRARTLSSTLRLLLAGGLTPGNVGEAIRTVRPWGVDVSSGVERQRGVKDPELIQRFVLEARSAGRSSKP